MKILKKYWPLGIIVIVVIILVALIVNQPKPGMIFFYGDGCPHCKIVEDYMAANGVRDKLQFTEMEVFNNQSNADLMAKYARQCGLDTSQGLGVPFFFDGKNCTMGDQDIIKYFSDTLGTPPAAADNGSATGTSSLATSSPSTGQ